MDAGDGREGGEDMKPSLRDLELGILRDLWTRLTKEQVRRIMYIAYGGQDPKHYADTDDDDLREQDESARTTKKRTPLKVIPFPV